MNKLIVLFSHFNSITKLLSSGFLTSVGFILLSSNSFFHVDLNLLIEILVILQLHGLGLTISKLNHDSISYTYYLENKEFKPKITEFILTRSLFLVLPILLFSFYRFDFIIAIFIFINILLDQFSTLVISQLGFRHLFNSTLLLNLMSYPLFFLLFFIFSSVFKMNLYEVIFLFTFCIMLKVCFSSMFYSRIQSNKVQFFPSWIMGIQQILNYGLFKFDVLISSLPVFYIEKLNISKTELLEVLFLSRFPEFISGLTISLSVLYYPHLVFNTPKEFFERFKKSYSFLYFLFVLVAYLIFLTLWNQKHPINEAYLIAYFLNGLFIVFINSITFNLLRQKKIKQLNFNLLISCSIGVSYVILVQYFLGNSAFFVVPIQMIIFLILFFLTRTSFERKYKFV